MATTALPTQAPFRFVYGEDEYSVKRHAKSIMDEWTAATPEAETELIDSQVSNAGEALRVLGRLREALQTLPFFGGGKIIWLRDCNFLGDDRTASSQEVAAFLVDLAKELKDFPWQGVQLLISAGKVDKRKTFFKSAKSLARMENFDGWKETDRNWQAQAESWIRNELRDRRKQIQREALTLLIECVGPNPRLLSQEIEKLCLYCDDEAEITRRHVAEIAIQNKSARAFALGDALGDRDLVRLLRTLDEELWGVKQDRQKSEIGLLYGLISKVRTLLLAKEMLNEKMLRVERDYARFQAQWQRLPKDRFPEDRRYNPVSMQPFVIFKALSQARHYSSEELVRAMEGLLQCNHRLVTGGLDSALVLQQTLIQIVKGA